MTRLWGLGCAVLVTLLLTSGLASAKDTATAVKVGIVWWPANPDHPVLALGNEFEDCIIDTLGEVEPDVVMTRQRAIRDALFPLLEPATQPQSESAFVALLGREDVRGRLARLGLRYLIAFAGGTDKEAPGGGIVCGGGFGAGGCFGYSWQNESTRLSAVLWSLDSGTPLRREAARSEGTSAMPAFILPVPIPARTKAMACRELGEHIGNAIRQAEAGNPGQP